MLNQATVIGNVGKQPEIRMTAGGQKFAQFSLATTERWRGKDGERREATEWHSVTVWDENLVNTVERFVTKGTLLMVEGPLRTEKYDARITVGGAETTVTKYATKIVLNRMGKLRIITNGAKPGEDAPPPVHPDEAATTSAAKPPIGDEDIPF